MNILRFFEALLRRRVNAGGQRLDANPIEFYHQNALARPQDQYGYF